MPATNDIDPVQDRKAAAEAAIANSTVSELQQQWREATDAYWIAQRAVEQAKKNETAAREVMEAAEQNLGRAIAAQLTNEVFDHQQTALVAVNGLLLRLTRTAGNSPHYYIRPADVVRL